MGKRSRETECEALGWLVSIKDDPLPLWLGLKEMGIGISSISVKKRKEMQMEEMGSDRTVLKSKMKKQQLFFFNSVFKNRYFNIRQNNNNKKDLFWTH